MSTSFEFVANEEGSLSNGTPTPIGRGETLSGFNSWFWFVISSGHSTVEVGWMSSTDEVPSSARLDTLSSLSFKIFMDLNFKSALVSF